MVGALKGFGLAIGSMDIIGAIFFEIMIISMLCRRDANQKQQQQQQQQQQQSEGMDMCVAATYASVISNHQYVAAVFGKDKIGPGMLWTYLILLNIWILSSILLVIGIVWHKPELLLFWLIWCLGGLIFDVVYVLWWCLELISGDTIEALTNILISMLTMAIEFSFVYVVYSIYSTLLNSTDDQVINSNPLMQLAYFLF